MAITQRIIIDTSDAIRDVNRLEDALRDLSSEINQTDSSLDVDVNTSSATREINQFSSSVSRASSEVDELRSSIRGSTGVIRTYDNVIDNAGGSTMELISATNGAVGGFVGFTRAVIANTVALLANPVGLVAVAVTGLVTALYSAVEAFKSTTGGAKEFAEAIAPYQFIIKQINEPLKKLGEGITDVMGRFGNWLALLTGNKDAIDRFIEMKKALSITDAELEIMQANFDSAETSFEKFITKTGKYVESLDVQLKYFSNSQSTDIFNKLITDIKAADKEVEGSGESLIKTLESSIKKIEDANSSLSPAGWAEFEILKQLEKDYEVAYNKRMENFTTWNGSVSRAFRREATALKVEIEEWKRLIGDQSNFIGTEEEYQWLKKMGDELTTMDKLRFEELEKARINQDKMSDKTKERYASLKSQLAAVNEQMRGVNDTSQEMKDSITKLQGLKANIEVQAVIDKIDMSELTKVDVPLESGKGFSIIDSILPSEEELEERAKAIENSLYIDTSAEDAFIESIVRQNDAAKEYEKTWKDIESAVSQTLEYTTPEIQLFGDSVVSTFKLMQDEGTKTSDKMISVAKSTSLGFQAIGSLMNDYYEAQMHQGEDLTEAQIAENEKLFENQKKVNIATATIDMLAGTATAFATAQSLGPILGPIVGGINAAAVIATGIAQINTIKNTQLNSNGSISGSTNSSNATTYPAVPEFEFDSGLSEGIFNDNGNEETALDSKVYVLESDITSVQNKVKAIESESTF